MFSVFPFPLVNYINLKVRRIYSVICHQDMTPNNETFRSMINLCVRMKDVCFCLVFLFVCFYLLCMHTHAFFFPLLHFSKLMFILGYVTWFDGSITPQISVIFSFQCSMRVHMACLRTWRK